MKKIIFIFISLFIFITSSNSLSKFYLGEKIPDMHVETITNEMISHNGVPFIIRRDDGMFVYCLDHQQKVNTYSYYTEYNYNDEVFNLTNEQVNKINLIAYYGYNYKNHTDLKWYGITQFLIWKELNYKDIYFTDIAYGNKVDLYKEEIEELNNLVNNYTMLPSFSKDNFEYTINNIYEIKDLNNVLSNYEIKESNIDVEINNNSVYIKTKKDGNYQITFIRKSPIEKDYILYEYYGNQPLIYPGRINDIEFKINIEVNSGSITINNIDSENKSREFANLDGATYGVYDKEELITTIITDSNGVGYLEEIPLGQYIVKQLTPSIGYKLDNNIYEINITKENKNIVINSYSDIIIGNLIINKYFGSENNYKLEDGAIFEIYDINNNFIGKYESEDGVINIKLEYGKYYIEQIKGVEGYKLEDRKYINILEEKNYKTDLYDEIIIGNLKINKYYGDKLEDGAIFEIYDMEDKLIGVFETENGIINIKLEYGEYYGIQTKGINGYNLVDKFNIFIKEEKEYVIDLYSEKLKEPLIVEVPNTKKNDYNYFISISFIIIGIIFIIKAKKATI